MGKIINEMICFLFGHRWVKVSYRTSGIHYRHNLSNRKGGRRRNQIHSSYKVYTYCERCGKEK